MGEILRLPLVMKRPFATLRQIEQLGSFSSFATLRMNGWTEKHCRSLHFGRTGKMRTKLPLTFRNRTAAFRTWLPQPKIPRASGGHSLRL